MGGKGSGWGSEDVSRAGRKKKSAIAVSGSGTPTCPDDLPEAVKPYWWRFADVVQGIAFEQDTEAVTEAAYLLWRQQKFREALQSDPLNDEMNRLSLAVGRSLSAIMTQFGMTPRSRQILLVPKEEEPKDEFEELAAQG